MAYVRKTRDVYRLIWNGEVIDEFYNRKEAFEMRKEYALAYNCYLYEIVIKTGRERIEA